MTESNCSVMREVTLDKNVSVESSHLRNSEYTDTTEGLCRSIENFSLCNICTKVVVRCALQSVECDITGNDVTLKCSLCNFLRKVTSHDSLELHLAA